MTLFELPCCTNWRTVCHNVAFMFMWHYQNAHMTAHQLWIPTRRHRKTSCNRALADMTFLPRSCVFPIDIPPVQPSVSLCFFYSKLHPLHPKVNPIRWMFCRGSDFFFVPRSCYLLAADKPMNSGAKWNSYYYQKHKIPITLDVRAETRKWNRYS